MYYIKKVVKYLSGIAFFILGFILLCYYEIFTIDLLAILERINVKIMWIVFIVFSLPFIKECLSALHELIIRFFGIIEKMLFTDGLRLIFYKLKLHRRRLLRRFYLLVEWCNSIYFLGPLWLIFIIILHFFTGKEYIVLFDEAKFSFFSSVILVCIVTIRDRIIDYKEKLHEQYDLYTDFWYHFEIFIYDIIVNNSPSNSFDLTGSWWCFTDERYNRISECIEVGSNDMNTTVIRDDLGELNRILHKVKKMLSSDSLLCDTYNLSEYVENCFEIIRCIQKKDDISKSELHEFCDIMYRVLRRLRYPWRRDMDLDRKISKILMKRSFSLEYDDIDISIYDLVLADEDYDTEYPNFEYHRYRVKVRKRKK